MTTREMIYDAWVLAGEPSDNDPILAGATYSGPDVIDGTSVGALHYLREISQAQRVLANWKTSRNRPIRFKKFLTQRNVKVGFDYTYDITYVTPTILRVPTYTSLPTGAIQLTEDMLETARIDVIITGTVEELVDGVLTTVTKSLTNEYMCMQSLDIGGDILELYLRDEIVDAGYASQVYTMNVRLDRFKVEEALGVGDGSTIVLPPTVRNVTRISTASDGGNVGIVGSKEDLYNLSMRTGTPSEYYILGGKVYFDVYIDDPLWLIVEFQRLPHTLTDVEDVLDIPPEWHAVVLSIMEWREAERVMDTEKGMVKRSQITSLINTLRTDEEEEWIRNDTGGFFSQTEAK